MTEQLIVRTEGRLGRITLNRPKALNALTLEMVRGVEEALRTFAHDDVVGVVLIDGAGDRGLCAGGDIRAIYHSCMAGDAAPIVFWQEEYRMNAHIARYAKPLVAFMDGIVMGGGVGISAHASFRVVTERSVIAMPEVAIGSVPDVGGTYLLSRAPGELGVHVALTAARLAGADAIALGLADALVPSERLAALTDTLRGCAGRFEVEQAIRSFSTDAGAGALAPSREWIDDAYAGTTIEEIQTRLVTIDTEGARDALAAMARMSPTSLKVTLRALREARVANDLEACLRLELRILSASLARPDLAEGIRALVIDKDQTPRWSPPTLDEVSDDVVDSYFRQIGERELTFGPAPTRP